MSRASPPSGRHHPLLDPDAPLPLRTPRQRRLAVREVLKTTLLPHFADPREIADGLRIPFVYYFPEAGEPHPGEQVAAYAWRKDPRERDWLIHLEIARVVLWRAGDPYNESDVLLVAYDLAVPEEAVVLSAERLVREQQHCPEAILHRIAALRLAHSPKR